MNYQRIASQQNVIVTVIREDQGQLFHRQAVIQQFGSCETPLVMQDLVRHVGRLGAMDGCGGG